MYRVALLWIFLVGLSQCTGAVEFVVGGDAGWTLPSFGHTNYTEWTTGTRFHIGDTLVFNYPKEFHNVLVVNKVDFISCSNVNPIATFQDGHTVINLNKSGPHFYICGVPGHCGQGQKLMAVVRKRGNGHHGPSPAPSGLHAVHAPAHGPASGAVRLGLSWAAAVVLAGFLVL